MFGHVQRPSRPLTSCSRKTTTGRLSRRLRARLEAGPKPPRTYYTADEFEKALAASKPSKPQSARRPAEESLAKPCAGSELREAEAENDPKDSITARHWLSDADER